MADLVPPAGALSPSQFPMLRQARAHPLDFDTAVGMLVEGAEAGPIRNVDLQDAKDTLSRILDTAWTKNVLKPHFSDGRLWSQPLLTRDLYHDIHLMGLHSVIAASKKASKSHADGPAAEAIRAFVAEALPLAMLAASLKDKVVKGRAPATGTAAAINPDKHVRTCPVCFRQIAVRQGKMVHHGYSRPEPGWQTASCQGIRFPPLEQSPAGLEWVIGWMRQLLHNQHDVLAKPDQPPETLLIKRGYTAQAATVRRGDPGWQVAFERHVQETKSNIKRYSSELAYLERLLSQWRPVPNT